MKIEFFDYLSKTKSTFSKRGLKATPLEVRGRQCLKKWWKYDDLRSEVEMIFKNLKIGFSLVETLITLSIMSIAGLMLTKMNVIGMKANKHNEIRSDLQDIKRTIINQINCDQTFASFGSTRPINCTTGTAITLKNRSGNPIATNGLIGEWNINARCEIINSQNGLSIYATKQISPGTYKVDPLNNKLFDENHPISRLFNPDVRLCSEYFESPNDGWVAVPPFDSYATQVLPPHPSLPGSPVFTIRYGITSSAGNYSPTEWCVQNGYKYSVGVCRGRAPSNLGDFLIESPLIANTMRGNWSYSCLNGVPNYIWVDPTTQILCR